MANAFSIFRRQEIFSLEEKEKIVLSIRAAERLTSAEIRVFVEKHCRFVDPLDRAAELFWQLRMEQTEKKNAVLIYVAVRDHQYAVYADDGIHKALGLKFWNEEVAGFKQHFRSQPVPEAMRQVVDAVANALKGPFPFDPDTDRNELADEIVFG